MVISTAEGATVHQAENLLLQTDWSQDIDSLEGKVETLKKLRW